MSFTARYELALIVENPVAGEVQQQQIVGAFFLEQPRDGLAHVRGRFIDQRTDFSEVTNITGFQQTGEIVHILGWRDELCEAAVVVFAVADDKSDLPAHGCFHRETI